MTASYVGVAPLDSAADRHPEVTCPEDGDPRNAASVVTPLQELADYAALLADKLALISTTLWRYPIASGSFWAVCWHPAYSPYEGAFVIVGSDAVATSIDGEDWNVTTTGGKDLYAVCSNGTTVVAVGVNACYSGASPASWSSRTIPAGTYRAVCWTGSRFVAVGDSNVCATSPDGITWTARTIGTGAWKGIAWNGAVLVAVGGNVVSTSNALGESWVSRTPVPGTYYGMSGTIYRSVTWATELGLFCAVGAGAACMTSPTGVTWTGRNIGRQATGSPLGDPYSIAWNGRVFMVVGDDGFAWASADGIHWKDRKLTTGLWLGVSWGGAVYAGAQRFIAVGTPDFVAATEAVAP